MRWIVGILLVAIATTASQGLAEQERGIAVTGYGEMKTEPDIAKVSLGIFIFEEDLLAAKRDADKKIAGILAILKKMDIKSEDVTTTLLNVNPKYNKGGESVVFEGYEITRSMTVTLRKISSLKELLEQSIRAGVNRIERIELATSKESDQSGILSPELGTGRSSRRTSQSTEMFWIDPNGAEPILQVRAAALCDDDRLATYLAIRPGSPTSAAPWLPPFDPHEPTRTRTGRGLASTGDGCPLHGLPLG